MDSSVFSGYGMKSSGMLHISAKEAYVLSQKDITIVDLRPEHEVAHKSFDVPQLIRCPYLLIENLPILLPQDKPLIIADAVGIHSKEAMLFLFEKGYTNIANLAGGFVDWEREGFPIRTNSKEALSGPCLCMLKPMRKTRKQTLNNTI